MPLQTNIVPLSELPLRNDFMFGEVMRTSDICQLFLEELLDIHIQRIEFIDKQKDFSDSYTHHGIRLDVYLRDEAGTCRPPAAVIYLSGPDTTRAQSTGMNYPKAQTMRNFQTTTSFSSVTLTISRSARQWANG